MSTRFFTNVGEQTLFRKLKGVFESNLDLQWFDAVIGYLRASGYFAIRPYLEKIPHIRIRPRQGFGVTRESARR